METTVKNNLSHTSTPNDRVTLRQKIQKQIDKMQTYQSINLPDFKLTGQRGELEERKKILFSNCDFSGKKVMDLGCSNGYFCYELAKAGARVTGVDKNSEVISLNNRIAEYYGWDIHFKEAFFDLSFFEQMENYDVIIFFSVLQHIFNNTSKHPLEHCQKIINILSRKCDLLFFETGQSGEPFRWSRKLSVMGTDPAGWILKNFFEDSLFTDIKVIDPPAFTQGKMGKLAEWICVRYRNYSLSPYLSARKLLVYLLYRVIVRNSRNTRYIFVAKR